MSQGVAICAICGLEVSTTENPMTTTQMGISYFMLFFTHFYIEATLGHIGTFSDNHQPSLPPMEKISFARFTIEATLGHIGTFSDDHHHQQLPKEKNWGP